MAASQQQASAASSAAGVSGPGSAGGPGPQQQSQPPAQLVGPAQSGLLQQQQQDFDPVQRYKMLIPQLKESLQVINWPEAAEKQAGLPGGRRTGREQRLGMTGKTLGPLREFRAKFCGLTGGIRADVETWD